MRGAAFPGRPRPNWFKPKTPVSISTADGAARRHARALAELSDNGGGDRAFTLRGRKAEQPEAPTEIDNE